MFSLPAALVAPDRLAVDASDARDLALGAAALEQRVDSGPLVGFQDIHSLAFPRGRPELLSCQQVPAAPALTSCPRSTQVEEFGVAITGGVWVAAGEVKGLVEGRVDEIVFVKHDFGSVVAAGGEWA